MKEEIYLCPNLNFFLPNLFLLLLSALIHIIYPETRVELKVDSFLHNFLPSPIDSANLIVLSLE